jgi:adenine-specific DNA glycosylase
MAEGLVQAASGLPLHPRQKPRFPISGPCSALNQALMELGALICTPRQTRCDICPLQTDCRAFATGRVGELPRLAPRAAVTERTFTAFALGHKGRWLLLQRPADTVNAHLWEFPSFETSSNRSTPEALLAREFDLSPAPWLHSLPAVRHSITRYRITVSPFVALLSPSTQPPAVPTQAGPEVPPGQAAPTAPATLKSGWFTPTEIETLALTSAHRKLWRHVLTQPIAAHPHPPKPVQPSRPTTPRQRGSAHQPIQSGASARTSRGQGSVTTTGD